MSRLHSAASPQIDSDCVAGYQRYRPAPQNAVRKETQNRHRTDSASSQSFSAGKNVKAPLAAPKNFGHREILATMYGAGLRVSEVANPKVSDVDGVRKRC
jgi:site-specific recombinase XerD